MSEDKKVKWSDLGTPERHERKEIGVRYCEEQKRCFAFARAESIASFYYDRKKPLITSAQKGAADLVARAYYIGWVGPKSCEYKDKVQGGNRKVDMADLVVQAQQTYKRAMKAAKKHSKLVHSMAVDDVPIRNTSNSGKVISRKMNELREGLDLVAKEFGFFY